MITRREFTKTMAAAMAMTSLPASAAFRLNIGVGTYSYHSLSIADMIAELKSLRISQIEMSRGEFMLFSKPDPALFRSTREKLDRADIQCVSYYSATIKTEEDIENALGFAKLLGAGHVTGDATGDVLARIDRRFSEEKLTFGIHNHYFKGQKFPYESPEDVSRTLAGLSSTIGATADIGQFASCGYDALQAIQKLAPRLQLVHLKDIQAAGDELNVMLGTGIAKVPQVMQELRRQKFAGLVAIEYEKEGPVANDMRREIEYARSLAG